MAGSHEGGIYSQLFYQFLLVALIPVFTLGVVTVVFARQLSLNSVKNELYSSTCTAAAGLTRELESYRASLELLAQAHEVEELFTAGADTGGDNLIRVNQKSYLILAGQSRWMDVQFVDLSGTILHSTSGSTGILGTAHTYWGILRALQGVHSTIFYPGMYGISEKGLTIASPVLKDEMIVGYAMLCISENALTQILDTYSQQFPVKHILTDENNYLLMDQIGTSGNVFLPLELRNALRQTEGECASVDLNNDPQIVCVRESALGLRLISMISVGLVVSSNRELIALVMLACVISVLFSLLAAQRLSRRIVQPIRIICDTMEKIENGATNLAVPDLWDNEFGMMARGFNHMLSQLMEQFRMNMERQDRLRLAELKNLQAQISPHFLYNTLESIKYMARLGMNTEIDTVISKLGILLRSGMNFKQDMIPLRSEMKVVESYVAIQQTRYPGKFTFVNSVSEELLDCLVPNLVIQPLVENAVVHGIEAKVGEGRLAISSRCSGTDMIIQVYDDGDGIAPDKLEAIFSSGGTVSGSGEQSRESIGIANVHRRLQLYYGEKYGLHIESVTGRFTKVCAYIPIIKREKDVPGSDC